MYVCFLWCHVTIIVLHRNDYVLCWYQTTKATVHLLFVRSTLSELLAKDVLKLGVVLFRQEQEYGVNMFNSLAEHDLEVYNLSITNGLTPEWAAMDIFQKKINEGKLVAKPQVPSDGPTVDPMVFLAGATSTARIDEPSPVPTTSWIPPSQTMPGIQRNDASADGTA
jgi:hypothetical protein